MTQHMAAKAIVKPLRRIRTASSMLDLGATADSNTESGPSGNIPRIQQQQHSLFVNSPFPLRLGNFVTTPERYYTSLSRRHIIANRASSPIYIPKCNQPLALEESGGKKESVAIVIDRLVGHDGHSKKGDEEDQQVFEMDDI